MSCPDFCLAAVKLDMPVLKSSSFGAKILDSKGVKVTGYNQPWMVGFI